MDKYQNYNILIFRYFNVMNSSCDLTKCESKRKGVAVATPSYFSNKYSLFFYQCLLPAHGFFSCSDNGLRIKTIFLH